LKTISRLAAVSVGVVITMGATVGFASGASAAYSTQPTAPAWTPDGPVHAIVNAGPVTYVGGSFTGGVAAVDSTDGSLKWTAHTNSGSDVRALALSSDGTHLLVGGNFTTVDGLAHKKLASLLVTNGTAQTNWKAAAGGTVRDMVVVGDTLYFGGMFKSQNGIAQGGLGAVLASTGKPVTAFAATTDANVYGLALSGSNLIVSGSFTTVNGVARASLASVTLATGALNGFNPARVCSTCNQYWDVAVDGNMAFIGSSGPGGRLAAYNLTSSLPGAKPTWTQNANGDVQAVTVSGGLVYAGGHFTTFTAAKTPRTQLAAVNESTGATDPFNPRMVTSYPGVWALTATTSFLYVGGHFTVAGSGSPSKFPYLAFFPV
jgi:hypothetical protein